MLIKLEKPTGALRSGELSELSGGVFFFLAGRLFIFVHYSFNIFSSFISWNLYIETSETIYFYSVIRNRSKIATWSCETSESSRQLKKCLSEKNNKTVLIIFFRLPKSGWWVVCYEVFSMWTKPVSSEDGAWREVGKLSSFPRGPWVCLSSICGLCCWPMSWQRMHLQVWFVNLDIA